MPSDYAPGGLLYNPNPTPAPDYLTPVGTGKPGQVWVTQYVGGSKGQTPIAGFWDYPGGGSAFGNLLNTSNLGSSLQGVTSGAAQAFTNPVFIDNALKTGATGALVAGGAALAGGALGLSGAGAAGAVDAASPYALGTTGAGFGSASVGAGTGVGLTSGGGTGLLAPGVSTIGNGIASGIAANAIAPTLGTTGAIAGSTDALASTATNAAGAAGATGAAKVATPITGITAVDNLLNKAIDNPAPVLGAVLGAAANSGTSNQTSTASKEPWGPAQAWMKANLGLGQELQKQYQANPFSLFQQQAYNNQAGLGNSFRGAVNSLVPQMNNFRPYQRTPQSQVASPYQFASPNLGFTSKPFGG